MQNRLFFNKLKTISTLTCLSLIITGCESTVDFGMASSSEYKLDATIAWHDDIKPDNTYFAYVVEISPSQELETMLSCEKGTGTPFSDLKQTYGLILSPANPNNTTPTNNTINLAQAAVVFEKDKTKCTTNALNKHLTPYQIIKDTNYQVNRVNYSSSEYEVDYDALVSTISISTQLATGTPFIFNDENNKTIKQATNTLDSALSQWLKDNSQSYTTTPNPLLAYSNGAHVPYELSIPIKYIDDQDKESIIGHVIVKPKFLRTVWLNPAESVGLPVIRYSDIKNKPLSNKLLFINRDSTYNNYIDTQGEGQLSLSDIASVGHDIDWNNPETTQVKTENETLAKICKKTKTILSDAGLHEYDQHLLLVQRLEQSELWKHRIITLPELPIKPTKTQQNDVDKKFEKLAPRKHIDLSSCLDYKVLDKQEYQVITQDAVRTHEQKWAEIKAEDKSLVEYFVTEIGQAFNTQENRNGIDIRKDKQRYINILQNRLFLPDNATVEFQDNRDYQPENWNSSDNNETLTSEALMSRFWDMDLFLYGCYLQPNIKSISGSEADINAVRMLYFNRNQHIGSITFRYTENNSPSLREVTIDPVYSNSINLTQVEHYKFKADSSCMTGPYPKIKRVLESSKSTAMTHTNYQ
ncbi:hypothetical protein ACU6DW_001798 [Vibrio fluvialis]